MMIQKSGPINLVKLCVGVQDIDQLEMSVARARKQKRLSWISTRMMPKRKDELCDGGSLYWVISGLICVRQKIIEMETGPTEMGTRAIIRLDPNLILTEAHPKRPFQGWRYLKTEDAPADLKQDIISNALPSKLENDIKAALAW